MEEQNKKHKIFLVDDETEILSALRRVFRRQYDVEVFEFGGDALAAMENEQVTVLISDMRMPVMDGAELLSKAKAVQPDTIRILLTGYSDMDSTAKAINEGEIFSYVSKPWNNNDLQLVVTQAVERYELNAKVKRLNAELQLKNEQLNIINQGLEEKVQQRTKALVASNDKLSNSLKRQRDLFQGVVEMVNRIVCDRIEDHQGHSKRIAFHCRMVAEELGLERALITRIYLAALTHEMGKVGLPDEILNTPESLMDNSQEYVYQQYVLKGADIIESIPTMAEVGEIIRHQNESWNGQGFPDKLAGDSIPVGARILRVVMDYDNLILGRKLEESVSPEEGIRWLERDEAEVYDKAIVKTYIKVLNELPNSPENRIDHAVSSNMIRAGMVVSQDVILDDKVLVTKDTELTIPVVEKLKAIEANKGASLIFFVY